MKLSKAEGFQPSLTAMFFVDLGRNKLSGPLPAEWKDKKQSLRHLHLDHNLLTGEIPSSFIGKLGNGHLQTLTLDHNLFEGSVPSQYASSSELGKAGRAYS